jgi:hypothetical protein
VAPRSSNGNRRRRERLLAGQSPTRDAAGQRKEREQIATQPAAVVARDPDGARPIERLGDGIGGPLGDDDLSLVHQA